MALYAIILMLLVVSDAYAQCPPSYIYMGGRCLQFQTDTGMTFEEAIGACNINGGRLAKINDCNLLGEVARYLGDNGFSGNHWIGASDIVEEASFVWLDGTPVHMGAPFWGGVSEGDDEPHFLSNACAVMDPNDGYYFHPATSNDLLSAICELYGAISGDCPSPFVSISSGCYSFLDAVPLTFEEAIIACQDIGGRLAVIDNCFDMGPIISYIEESGMTSYFWIGGSYDDGSWTWIDGSQMEMGTPFWGRNQDDGLQPNGGTSQNCVVLNGYDRYYFNDLSCDTAAAFVCETDIIMDTD